MLDTVQEVGPRAIRLSDCNQRIKVESLIVLNLNSIERWQHLVKWLASF